MTESLNRVFLSEIMFDQTLRLSLGTQAVDALAPGEVLVQVEAAPIHPSDIGGMLASADLATARTSGVGADRVLVANLRAAPTAMMARRIGIPVQIGNEGAGTVVAAADDCAAMIGKRVAMLGGDMFAQYRRIAAAECLQLPDSLASEDGAALFVNPLTALAMVETARREGHSGIVHTAAASSLGRMLGRICKIEGIPLVNIVRTESQCAELLASGEAHVVNTSSPTFADDLVEALVLTGGSIAFDAIGGGGLGSTILEAMETAALRTASSLNNYGTDVFKQLYIYGSLDPSPTMLERRYGLSWAIGGFLMTPALNRLGPETTAAMKARVLAEATTTFATNYTARIDLDDLLDPVTLAAIARRSTGEKYLLRPNSA